MPEIRYELIKGVFPSDKLGEVVEAFDAAGLGFSLRQAFTVVQAETQEGYSELEVAVPPEALDKADCLVEAFRKSGWMIDPRIEHSTSTYNEPTPERARALLDGLRNTPL